MAKNRFDLVGKTKAKLTNITILALKMGQRELKPAVSVRVKVTAHASILDKFSPHWREFLYEKNGTAAKQQAIEGEAKMQLTQEAVALGAFYLAYEQTGCVLIIYRGVSKLPLKDTTVKKVKITPHEGEAVDVEFSVHAADLDEETLGALAVLKQHEVDLELTLPEPLQQDIEGGKTISNVTPLGALKKAAEKEAAPA